ncbi:uncharacterized protein [Amphiura filiformis]|uniref:uncharacterized protein n=1 Tax=Amphiura filiformis TaxID=82378 RepID=UPI003B22807F
MHQGATQQNTCSICSGIIRRGGRQIQCFECKEWIHQKCTQLKMSDFNKYRRDPNRTWRCSSCEAPCGMCKGPINHCHKAVQCDNCEQWHHIRCGGMDDITYNTLHDQTFLWMCPACEVVVFSDSFFTSSSEKSFNSSNTEKSCDNSSAEIDDGDQVPIRKTPGTRGKLSILIINCQSIRNKSADLEVLIDTIKPDIIQATETWLNPDIKNTELPLDTYNVFRKDRSSSSHGGVLFASKKDLVVTEIALKTRKETLWTQLEIKGGKKVIFGTAYKLAHNDDDTIYDLQESLAYVNQKFPNCEKIISGDFNQPNIDWTTAPNYELKLNHWANVGTATKLLELMENNGLEQLVNLPTREENFLDLLFTSNSSLVNNITTKPGVSDHNIVIAEVQLNTRRRKLPPRKIYIRSKADEAGLRKDLSDFKVKYFADTTHSSVQDRWDKIEGAIKDAMEKNVPQRQSSNRKNLPWFDRTHKCMVRKKQKAYNRAKQTGKEEDWTYFKFLQKKLKQSLNKARREYISDNLDEALCNNPKSFWSFIKKIKQDEVGVADLRINDEIISDGKGKAEALNAQFASVFTEEDLSSIPTLGDSDFMEIPRLDIQEKGVHKLLCDLNANKASGPDNLPPWVLKMAADELAPVLTHFFQLSLDKEALPWQWRNANICGVYKKG